MRQQRNQAALLASAFLLLATRAPAAAEPKASEVTAKVQAWIDGTRDLTCRFEQTLVSGAFGADLRESGKLHLLRPGRIRFDYLDPEKKTALLVGDRTLLYLPEDRQLIEGKLDEDEAALPGLLAGQRRLAEVFEATLVPAPDRAPAGQLRLRLVPRKGAEGVRELILSVRAPEFAIEGAEILDGMGNRTSYLFGSVRRNRGVDEALFRFEPPAGTAIVAQ